MRYMFLVYTRETDLTEGSAEDMGKLRAAHFAVMDETQKRGIFRGAEPLQPVATATTVRIADDKPLVLDGPFAETKEQLGGYYLVEARDLNEAIQLAARIPGSRYGSIEVRPIMEMPTP